VEPINGLGPAGRRRWHKRVAWLMQRFPWSGLLVQRGYRLRQPRVTIGAVGVLLDGAGEQVFLVEHVLHAEYPWGLPGGWIGRGENPAQAVEREFREETGLHVRALRPLLIECTPQLRAHLDTVFLCVLDGEPQTARLSHELLSCRWTPLDALPPLVPFHRKAIRAAQRDLARCGAVEEAAEQVQGGGL